MLESKSNPVGNAGKILNESIGPPLETTSYDVTGTSTIATTSAVEIEKAGGGILTENRKDFELEPPAFVAVTV